MYLAGLHIYYKMIHGPYNIKLTTARGKACSVCDIAARIWEVPGENTGPETCYRDCFLVVSLTRTSKIQGLHAKLARDTSVSTVSRVWVGRPRNRGSISSTEIKLPSSYFPKRLCSPSNLLFNRYRRRFPVVHESGQ